MTPSFSGMSETRFIEGEAIHREVIVEAIGECRQFLWLATADLKDMHIARGKKAIPFLQRLSELIDEGVSVRLIHAKEPGPAFRSDYDRFPNLLDGMEMILCPRAHFKSVIVDGRIAYTGSANLTGAGLGMKNADRRNFEGGVLSSDLTFVRQVMQQFDRLWIGEHCHGCQRKQHCVTYHELIG